MKACFVNPPVEDFYYTSLRRQPLGLLYVMASVEAAGHRVSLINGHGPGKTRLPLPGAFRYLEPYIEDGTFPFGDYRRYGLSFEEIDRRVRASDADIFFVSAMFTAYHEETERVIGIIRARRPGAPVVAGGHHASLHTGSLAGLADHVIAGEGEENAAALLSEIEKGGRPPIVIGPSRGAPADDYPLPARRHLLPRDFRAYGGRAAAMITSRGCPHRCDFCTARVVWGDNYRARSPESVVGEIRSCVEEFGASMIIVEDDNMLADPDGAGALLEAVADYRRREHPALNLSAMNGLSIEYVDGRMLALMREAGFGEINISLVSASPGVQQAHGRPFDTAAFTRTAAKALELGMRVRAYFILGLPDQTGEEIRETVAVLSRPGVEVFPSVYYDVRRGRDEWKAQRSSAFFNETAHLSRRDLIGWFNHCLALHGTRGDR